MAGIGFAINQVMKEKKLTSTAKAYVYATAATVGPLFLGELVLLSIYFLSDWIRISIFERNLLISIIAYSMLFSLLWSSIYTLLISRYLSDCLYEKRLDKILPTFWGSIILILGSGSVFYFLFLLFSGGGLLYSFLALVLFCEFLITWNLINFLTAIQDYLSVFKAFTLSILGTLLSGWLLLWMDVSRVVALLGAMAMGYALYILFAVAILYRQFPNKLHLEDFFTFVSYIDKYWQLIIIGFMVQFGLASHIIIMWYGPIGVEVQGLFHVAPQYDITVLLAFVTILITPINFTISFEVKFLKVYQRFFKLFDAGGSLKQLWEAENAMIISLKNELKRIAWMQLIVTFFIISLGVVIVNALPLGFTATMNGYFRILCVAYALYALGNTFLLTLIYFADLEAAYWVSVAFAGSTTIATLLIILFKPDFLEYGFLIGAIIYFVLALFYLEKLVNRLLYQVLGKQPIQIINVNDRYYKLSKVLEEKVRALVVWATDLMRGRKENEQQE